MSRRAVVLLFGHYDFPSIHTVGAGYALYKDRVTVEVAWRSFVDIGPRDYLLANTHRLHTLVRTRSHTYISAHNVVRLYNGQCNLSRISRVEKSEMNGNEEKRKGAANAWSTEMKFPAGKPPFLYNVPGSGDYKYHGTHNNNILYAMLDCVRACTVDDDRVLLLFTRPRVLCECSCMWGIVVV